MSAEDWLETHAVRGGDVLSWVNPEHPGYAYPEAAGLLLRWWGLTRRVPPPAVVDTLGQLVLTNAVGRDGHTYAFDAGVALAGLEALDDDEDPRWTAARTRLATMPVVEPGAEPRWSTVPGPHLLKLAVGSAARARRGWSTPLRTWLAELTARQFSDGRIETPPHASTYLHAHAYATEGLMALEVLGITPPASAEAAVAFLSTQQRPDGSMPAWSDGGPGRADTTAQAIRLFVLQDPVAYAEAIERGLSFLDTLTDDRGVVRYEAGAGDRNTWCTLFAIQARRWAAGAPARVEDLL